METSTSEHHKQSWWLLGLGALGVVFGDIGTSPLYTMQECISTAQGINPHGTASIQDIFGIVSLIFWALTMVVTFKYIYYLMRADNRGEGGIMALLALLPDKLKLRAPGEMGFAAFLVIAGAALLFGDGIITPAISVLSAVEGLKVKAPGLQPYVVPLTIAILIFLFMFQRHGAEKIGKLFGPVMLVWFASIAFFGVLPILENPKILEALYPTHAIGFFTHHGWRGFRILGSVVLAVTGGEALYADMGHFGKQPIQRAWLFIVFPALIINYLGQAALLVAHPFPFNEINPFYGLIPEDLLYPMIGLATVATVIASQALISGAYSLSSQAIRLGYFPHLTVKHTSERGEGQIYVPFINWILAVLCILLVLQFESSARLASAYGLAVTGTMGITSIVFYLVTHYHWKWPHWKSMTVLIVFLSFDLPLFAANVMKFMEGGWIPVLVGTGFFLVMWLWKRGRSLLAKRYLAKTISLDSFLEHMEKRVSYRVPGTAVFLASASNGVPPVVMRMVRRFHSVHKTVILLTVTSENVPYFCTEDKEENRVEVAVLGSGFYRVIARFGFMEIPDVPKILGLAFNKLSLHYWERDILYILGHETFVERDNGTMPKYQQMIFAFLSRNARNATDYFHLPPAQVIELGAQIDL